MRGNQRQVLQGFGVTGKGPRIIPRTQPIPVRGLTVRNSHLGQTHAIQAFPQAVYRRHNRRRIHIHIVIMPAFIHQLIGTSVNGPTSPRLSLVVQGYVINGQMLLFNQIASPIGHIIGHAREFVHVYVPPAQLLLLQYICRRRIQGRDNRQPLSPLLSKPVALFHKVPHVTSSRLMIIRPVFILLMQRVQKHFNYRRS